MSVLAGCALLAGLGLGAGLWVLVAAAPSLRRPRLADRLAPHLLDVSAEARELVRRRSAGPLPVLAVVAAPVLDTLTRLLDALLGGRTLLRLRLHQAGWGTSPAGWRSLQLALAVGGAIAGLCLLPVLAGVTGARPELGPVLAIGGALLAVVLSERVLTGRSRARLGRMARELPAVLEFLTLSLSAGEGVPDALARVARVNSGELVAELRAVVARVHAGVPLVDALHGAAAELAMPAFTRFAQQLTGALERGAPVAEVLRSQAQDAREDGKRELLEAAGRKEVAMLVPLVFLILPVTVLFAVFPGLVVLRLGL